MNEVIKSLALIIEVGCLCFAIFQSRKLIKKKSYSYYISYVHSRGVGYSIMIRKNKIKTMAHVLNLINDIEKINNVEQVTIFNWIELKN